MQRARLVPLLRVTDPFQARVVAARLESEGIACRLQGALDGPYPLGEVAVLVPEVELTAASEVLLVDEVDAFFAELGLDEDILAEPRSYEDLLELGEPEGNPPWQRRRPRWLLVVAVAVVTAMLLPFVAALSSAGLG